MSEFMISAPPGLSKSDVAAMTNKFRAAEILSGTTDASGNVQFIYGAQYAELPFISVQLIAPRDANIKYRVTQESLLGCTINVQDPETVSVAIVGLVLSNRLQNVAGQQIRIIVSGD